MDKEKTSLREKARYSFRRNQMPAVTYAKLLRAEVINHLGWGMHWGFRKFPRKKSHSYYMTMAGGGGGNQQNPIFNTMV